MELTPTPRTPKTIRSSAQLELTLIGILAVLVIILAASFDILERIVTFSQEHEDWELDEVISLAIFLVGALGIFSVRRWLEVRKASTLLDSRNKTLQKALAEIKQLKGTISICSSCKKIKNDDGAWEELESYIHAHSDADFSHGLCATCARKLYPDILSDTEIRRIDPQG